MDEIGEISVVIEYAQRPVLRIHEIRCRLDDAPQRGRQFQASRNGDNRGEQPPIDVLAHSPIMPASPRDGYTRGKLGHHLGHPFTFLLTSDLLGVPAIEGHQLPMSALRNDSSCA